MFVCLFVVPKWLGKSEVRARPLIIDRRLSASTVASSGGVL